MQAGMVVEKERVMIDLRFVEREVPDWIEPCKLARMKTVKILQWRYCEPCATHGVYHDDFTGWSEWEDVPTEKEGG